MTDLVRYDAMCRAIDALERCEHTFWYPELPGVYVFDGVEGVLYVGESRNLRRRLRTHERGYLRRSVGVRCRIVPCSNHKQVERWLIAELKPSLNGVSEAMRPMRGSSKVGIYVSPMRHGDNAPREVRSSKRNSDGPLLSSLFYELFPMAKEIVG